MVTWQSWHFADDGEGHDWPEHFFFFFHEFRIKNARDTSKRQSNGVMKQAQETGMNDAARRVRDRKQRGRERAHTQKRVCEIEGRRKKKVTRNKKSPLVKVLRQDGGRGIEAEVNRCCFVHCIRFLLTSPYCKAFIYTHTPIYISIVNNHTLLSEEQSLTEGRGGEAVRREESTKWRAARGGAGRARRSFYLLERLFAEVERAKARSKFPSCGRSCLEVGRERAGGAAPVSRVAKRCFYYIHKQ